jgi:uncharacterized membrane protein YfcA
MLLEPLLVIELLALGVVAGFMAGLLGIGGGMMMVPVMTWMLVQRGIETGFAVKMAIATAMATIMFTALSSVRAHHRLGTVRWDIVRSMAPGIVLGGLAAGAGAFALLKGRGLALVFAAFLGYMAVQMLLDRKPRPGRQLPGAAGRFAVGSGIGFASALVGAGGAFLSVPFMTWCNVQPRQAVGTGAALGFPIAGGSTLGYVVGGWGLPAALPGAFGYLYLPALALVALASVSLAPLGARTAHRINMVMLKRLFALMLLALAASMLVQAYGA